MSEPRDPLDDVFGDDAQPVTTGQDTQTGTDTQTAPSNDTQTAPEAPGKDTLTGGQGDDTIDVEGKTAMVPKAALDEARRALREEREARTAAPAKAATEEPAAFVPIDPKEDPQGAYDQMMGIVQLNAVNTTLNFSEKAARKEHGKELVDKVMDWASKRFETDPSYASKVLTDPDPYEVAIADYKKSQRDDKLDKLDPAILEGLDADEIELLRQHRASKTGDAGAEGGGSTAADTQPRGEGGRFTEAPPRRKVDAPPRSIADAPSGGPGGQQTVATGEGVAFDEAFK